jgi:hypothetical protein
VNRAQLAHILRAAAIVDDPNILVVGSQSVLATFDEDELPDAATASMEVDLAYFDDPTEDKADAVDGAIGELSAFHEMNGVYAQGVSVRTAVLPGGLAWTCCALVEAVRWPSSGCFSSRTTASRPNWWRIGRRTSRSRRPCSSPP